MEKKKLTTEEFIRRAKLKHNDKYDYSKCEYTGTHKNVTIICKIHGKFEQEAKSHTTRGSGCPKCLRVKQLTTEEFIEKANNIHSNKYSYLNAKYTTTRNKLTITCSIHGNFDMSATHHLTGRGCPKCVGRNKTKEDYIKEAKLIHGNLYDYSELDFNERKTQIRCNKHGLFKVDKYQHINKKGAHGCPICSEPRGEQITKQYLIDNNIEYIKQKTFKECRIIQPLQFDFYIPKLNICIEYDGIQHFKPIEFFGGDKCFEFTKKSDKVKTDYCLLNKIPLHRIKYNENILKKLDEIFGGLK